MCRVYTLAIVAIDQNSDATANVAAAHSPASRSPLKRCVVAETSTSASMPQSEITIVTRRAVSSKGNSRTAIAFNTVNSG